MSAPTVGVHAHALRGLHLVIRHRRCDVGFRWLNRTACTERSDVRLGRTTTIILSRAGGMV
ncbi:hypothetical protein K4H00_24465, partial [Mycobacterium tuberculosis]|nr:hypothetical protein [Mycobacterium tuberculosis]